MARVIRSRRARQDLFDIWRYVADDSEAAAERLLKRLDVACRRLLMHPHTGMARDDIRPGLRHLVVRPYLILYRFDGRDIRIIRVVHGRRDLGQLL